MPADGRFGVHDRKHCLKTKFLLLSAPASWLLRLGRGEEGSVKAAAGAAERSEHTAESLYRFRPPMPKSHLKREHVTKEEIRDLGSIHFGPLRIRRCSARTPAKTSSSKLSIADECNQ